VTFARYPSTAPAMWGRSASPQSSLIRSGDRTRSTKGLVGSTPLREPSVGRTVATRLPAGLWPVVGHWDSIEGWRASAGEFGVKLLDLSHWMAIPEIPTSE
jgi:hypothetical protein